MIKLITEQQALAMASTPAVRIPGLLGTHSGVRHADDAFAVAAIVNVRHVQFVVSTRNQAVLDLCEHVVDVGGVHNPEDGRFDHHQKGGAGSRPNGVPYAAFGLVWKYLGILTINRNYGADLSYSNMTRAMQLVDESLVQAIDASDCGFTSAASDPFADATPRYSLSMAISAFNPDWSEADQDFDAAFARAVEFAQAILRREIISAAGKVGAAEVVRAALSVAEGEILSLSRFCPWQSTVLASAPHVKFVVFPSETSDWRVQAVPVCSGSYETRMSLPATWAGLRTAKLAAAVRASGGSIGDDEAAFCHDKLFIGGATTFEGAMQMARAALPKVAEVSIDLTDLRERA